MPFDMGRFEGDRHRPEPHIESADCAAVLVGAQDSVTEIRAAGNYELGLHCELDSDRLQNVLMDTLRENVFVIVRAARTRHRWSLTVLLMGILLVLRILKTSEWESGPSDKKKRRFDVQEIKVRFGGNLPRRKLNRGRACCSSPLSRIHSTSTKARWPIRFYQLQ
jgi:hypothetical protein